MVPSIVPAAISHIPHIAANIREADKTELWDYLLMRPMEALTMSLEVSTLAWTGMADDIPVCMFGVAPASTLTDTGRPWMIGTRLVDVYAFAFLRRNRKMVEVMKDHYPRLENYVEDCNTRAIQWLKWLKFTIGRPEPIGPFQKPFCMFWMES